MSINESNRTAPAAGASRPRRVEGRRRLDVVGLAVGVALIWWAVLSQAAGIDLQAKQGSVTHINGVSVFVATLVTSLAGWGLLAVLERRTPNARNVWTLVATIFCLTSLGSPLLNGIGMDAKLALASLHLVVGAVVILGLRRTALTAQERCAC
ncbi:hypothetical protein EV138_5998 [Kribbella voronezhensis]|uniref:Uncharacterized protein n=1 Tax=Kribbella voronezhensis TaxID=2512212 RepID=A0A4R7SWD3_9ACTN|nr:DUF6069 family protein [Kribbella voronezhensis]TDU83534.1 hypothetical protein EV138_5998 [Kribbella voronezhensis]